MLYEALGKGSIEKKLVKTKKKFSLWSKCASKFEKIPECAVGADIENH